MAKKSRVPDVVASIPVLGEFVRNADAQAQWMQQLVEQNARLLGQLPSTVKTFNDSLEHLNQTVRRLDQAVTRIERAAAQLATPLEQIEPLLAHLLAVLEVPGVRDVPALVESLRSEALPALRAAVDTQREVALLVGTLERALEIIAEVPGGGILRHLLPGRPEAPAAEGPGGGSAVSARVSTPHAAAATEQAPGKTRGRADPSRPTPAKATTARGPGPAKQSTRRESSARSATASTERG